MHDESDDATNQDTQSDGGSWVERHLAKIIAGVLTFCLLALVGRALTG